MTIILIFCGSYLLVVILNHSGYNETNIWHTFGLIILLIESLKYFETTYRQSPRLILI